MLIFCSNTIIDHGQLYLQSYYVFTCVYGQYRRNNEDMRRFLLDLFLHDDFLEVSIGKCI